MTESLHIQGEWPSPVLLTKGWAKARGRPWNDFGRDGALRLDRGGVPFLRSAAEYLSAQIEGSVFSPALVASSSRVWRRAGFDDFARLDVMERAIGADVVEGPLPVIELTDPEIDVLATLDAGCFEGFWSIGRSGIAESLTAAPATTVLLAGRRQDPVGYAIVGLQMGTAFLQRIAVLPGHEGRGHGRSLLSAGIGWAVRHGARSMVLNVRPGNGRAHDLYVRNGFVTSPYQLQVLAFG